MTTLLAAHPILDPIKQQLTAEIKSWKKQNIHPQLVVINASDDQASKLYVKRKKQFCESIGAQCHIVEFPSETTEDVIVDNIQQINSAKVFGPVHGILVQLPLPAQIRLPKLLTHLPAEKDVDGLHPTNVAKLVMGQLDDALIPCTPRGIVTLLNQYNIAIAKKHILVIGRSAIVGKPLVQLLNSKNATVTWGHSQTQNLPELSQYADIIISATGQSTLTREWIYDEKLWSHKILVDVGIRKVQVDDKVNICGDIAFDDFNGIVAGMTPVPGGIGPMTIASLAENLLKATQLQHKKER